MKPKDIGEKVTEIMGNKYVIGTFSLIVTGTGAYKMATNAHKTEDFVYYGVPTLIMGICSYMAYRGKFQ